MTKFLRAKDVAKLLDISIDLLYSEVNRGAFPVVRVGRMLRFDPTAVEFYIKTGGVAPGETYCPPEYLLESEVPAIND
jgi:predicted DNA-binding transcriptional regulator AlpA